MDIILLTAGGLLVSSCLCILSATSNLLQIESELNLFESANINIKLNM